MNNQEYKDDSYKSKVIRFDFFLLYTLKYIMIYIYLKIYEIIMGKTLDLSALKNKAQNTTNTIQKDISLWATVQSTTTNTAKQNTLNSTQVVETQKLQCDCPIPESLDHMNSPESKNTWAVTHTQNTEKENANIQDNIKAPIQAEQANIKNTTNISANTTAPSKNIAVEAGNEEEESKKTMISLNSIKSNIHTKKKEEEETVDSSKEKPHEEEKANTTLKKITVVAPAMQLPSENKSETSSSENSSTHTWEWENKNNTGSVEWIDKIEAHPVDEKLVAEESKKLKKQIENDLKETEKQAKKQKDIEVDDDIFDNYKPKYGGKEQLKEKNISDAKPVFKKHLSTKKRNLLLVWLLLFVLWISAGGYMFFNNSGVGNDEIQAVAVENNIAQTKENVENIISPTEESDGENQWDIEQEEDEFDEEENEGEEIDEDVQEDEDEEEISNENIEENSDDENANGELAQTENSWESKVKDFLLDNYYR